MDLNFLFRGIAIGFCVAAPVGPVGIVCIRRALRYGRVAGFSSGLGASLADLSFAIISAFGLTLISDLLYAYRTWLHIAGGIFLLILGMKIFFSKPHHTAEPTAQKGALAACISTFFITLTNPLTIFAFLTIFASIGAGATRDSAIPLVIGVFLGASTWWFLLIEFVTLFRNKITTDIMTWINRTSGALIFLIGIAAFTLI